MGKLSSLVNSCRAAEGLPYLLEEKERLKRTPGWERQFYSLRSGIQEGRYTTGDKLLDFCFLAAYEDFSQFGAGNGHRECFEYLRDFRSMLSKYPGELVLLENDKGLLCGRISKPPLAVDVLEMNLGMNVGKRHALNADGLNYWTRVLRNIPLIDAKKYKGMDEVDVTSDIGMVTVGDEKVMEKLGSCYDRVNGLLMPVPKGQTRLAL